MNKKLRNLILMRDNYICYNCLLKYNIKYLDIHHVFNKNQFFKLKNNSINLITLCKTCHIGLHTHFGKYTTLTHLEIFTGKIFKLHQELLELFQTTYKKDFIL